MHDLIPRRIEPGVVRGLGRSPIVALLGPRQCGKSTLAKQVIARIPGSVYLDLERPAHANRLNDPELFFEANRGRLVCLDEIQRRSDLFPVMKSIVDERGTNGQFLVLGSASPELLRQGSETLAGRLAYLNLTPFLVVEGVDARGGDVNVSWLRGGFPRSRLAASDNDSLAWREDFIATFLERDVPHEYSTGEAARRSVHLQPGATVNPRACAFDLTRRSVDRTTRRSSTPAQPLDGREVDRVERPYRFDGKRPCTPEPDRFVDRVNHPELAVGLELRLAGSGCRGGLRFEHPESGEDTADFGEGAPGGRHHLCRGQELTYLLAAVAAQQVAQRRARFEVQVHVSPLDQSSRASISAVARPAVPPGRA